LVPNQRERTQENSFDPTENRGTCADSKRQAKNRESGKTGASADHSEGEVQILYRVSQHVRDSTLGRKFR
jgi:hypothetical protein